MKLTMSHIHFESIPAGLEISLIAHVAPSASTGRFEVVAPPAGLATLQMSSH